MKNEIVTMEQSMEKIQKQLEDVKLPGGMSRETAFYRAHQLRLVRTELSVLIKHLEK